MGEKIKESGKCIYVIVWVRICASCDEYTMLKYDASIHVGLISRI